MFFGEYLHQLDEKGRLRLPSKIKCSNQIIITKGTNNCLFVFEKNYFENQFLSKLENVPTFDIESQKPIRALLSSSFEITEDNQGRFLLPNSLKDFAKISKNIVFVGVGNRLEIWSEENWKAYNDSDKSFDEVVSKLSKYEI